MSDAWVNCWLVATLQLQNASHGCDLLASNNIAGTSITLKLFEQHPDVSTQFNGNIYENEGQFLQTVGIVALPQCAEST